MSPRHIFTLMGLATVLTTKRPVAAESARAIGQACDRDPSPRMTQGQGLYPPSSAKKYLVRCFRCLTAVVLITALYAGLRLWGVHQNPARLRVGQPPWTRKLSSATAALVSDERH